MSTDVPLSQVLGGGGATSTGFLAGTPVGGVVYLPEDSASVVTANSMTFLRGGSLVTRAESPALANTAFDLPNQTTFRNFNSSTGLTTLPDVMTFSGGGGWKTPDGAALFLVSPTFGAPTDLPNSSPNFAVTFRFLNSSGVIGQVTSTTFVVPANIYTGAGTASIRCRVARMFYSGSRLFAIVFFVDSNNPGSGSAAYGIYEFTASGGAATLRYNSGWNAGTQWTHPIGFQVAISGSRIILMQTWNPTASGVFVIESSDGGTNWTTRNGITSQFAGNIGWIVGTPTRFVMGVNGAIAHSTTGASGSWTTSVASSPWAGAGAAQWIGGDVILAFATGSTQTQLGRSADAGATMSTITVPSFSAGSHVSFDPLRNRMYIGNALMTTDAFLSGQSVPVTLNNTGGVVSLGAINWLYRIGAFLVGSVGEMRDTPNGAIGIERPATLGSLVNYLRIA